MYDYHLVFIYPFQPLVEDLAGVEESVFNELEKSITESVDDGWEYVRTTTFSKSNSDNMPSDDKGLKSFVYRRPNRASAESTEAETLAPMKPVKRQSMKNETELTSNGSRAWTESKETILLTMALLNAVSAHSQIEPKTILSEFAQSGEITKKELQTLSAMLKNKLSAPQVAKVTPRGHEKNVFRVSLMPFGAEDNEYAEYITELGVHLNLDDTFILNEVARKQL